MEYLELFWIFFRLGLFTFGGGYAMIPQIKETLVDKKGWITDNDMLELLAICESTPGPVAINMATYIGYKRKKFFGALLCTLGVVLPSFGIIIGITYILDIFMDNQYVKFAFMGINVCVAFLIIKAFYGLFAKMKKTWYNILILLIVLGVEIYFNLFDIKFSAIYLILIGGTLGIIYYSLKEVIRK